MQNILLLVLSLFSLGFTPIKAQNTTDCNCFMLYSPVCGENGVTYSNYCEAECENVTIVSEGSCQEPMPVIVTNAGAIFTYEYNLGPDTSPLDGPILSLWSSPDWADTEFGSYNQNNSESFGDFILSIEGTPQTADIGENYFIIFAQEAFSGNYYVFDTITVNVLPELDCICPAVAIPVCGVDGNTYGNNCLAACENIDIAYSGACITDTGCIGEFEISSQEYIAGFAGMMLHLQVQNTGNDLDFAFASLILDNTCFSNDQFSIETWASNTSQDLYFNYSCLSMAPYIEPFEAALILSGNTNCADEINFEFDPQGTVSPQGCTADNGAYYENGASWNLDDCTFCSCENGEIFCAVADCAAPTCENPIYQEGQCCPICEEEELIYGCTDPSADNYYANALFDDGSCIYSNLLDSCTYMGAIYALGASVTIGDETCTCEFNVEFDIISSVEMNCISTIDTMGCTSNDGELYPLGSSINSECETCTCVGSLLTIYPPEPPMWSCSEIADCEGEECECPTYYAPVCSNDNITYNNLCDLSCAGIEEYTTGPCGGETIIYTAVVGESYNFFQDLGTDCSIVDCHTLFIYEIPEWLNGGVYSADFGEDGGYGNWLLAMEGTPNIEDIGVFTITVYKELAFGLGTSLFLTFTIEVLPAEECECLLDIWDPVCASNGETYAYNCFAECLELDYVAGECSDFPDTTCICPLNYDPVCGSNGITYSNACFAECEVTDYYDGACLPTSFCELISVETETTYSADGQVLLNITVFNNSINNINYPVFGFGNTNEYVTIEPQFENAYWIGAGENTTNSYLLYGGNEEVLIEEVYYVSQLNQNAACPYPIEFVYNPLSNSEFCYANGESFPIGSTFTDTCEMCICTGNDATSPKELPMWLCEPIIGCEENPCSLVDCAPGFECINGDCIITESLEYGCELAGEIYAFGSSTEQGCNDCYCMAGFNPNANGIWSCTEMACYGCTDPEASNYDPYADIDNESCEYENTSPNWTSPNTGVNHTLILAEDILIDLNGTGPEVGDWIGVFYPLNNELVCGGYTIWEGNTTVIPAQGDDTTTDIQDGFTSNQEFQWLLWDASTNTIFSMEASYDQEMANQQLYTTNGISAIVTLLAQPIINNQQIQLTSGWNMFSTYIHNENLDIEALFTPYVDDLVIVKDYLGQAYLPAYNYNGIGYFLPGQGYQAKLTNTIEFNIEGAYLAPEENPIELISGWNLIAYIRTEPANTVSVFEEIEGLVIVKDNIGMAYLPEFGFNGIENMLPGEAYQVKVLTAQQLEYLPNNQSYRMSKLTVQNDLQYYKTPVNTGSNMSLVLKKEHLENWLSYGDEIGVYGETDNLVGAFVYQDQTIVMPVYGNDEYSREQDGLINEEALHLKYWSVKTKEEITLNSTWENSTGFYQQNSIQEISIVNSLKNRTQVEFKMQPNPAKHSTELNFDLAKNTVITFQLFNLMGKVVLEEKPLVFSKGKNSHTIKVDAFTAGTYLLKIQTKNTVYTKRLLVN